MESERFDELIRGAFAGATRRSVVRVGAGALAATALATLSHGPSDVDAKKKKKKKKKRCPSNRPVKCGNGCCPGNFSKCCESASEPVNSFTCNPPSFTCCTLEEGGGSCGPSAPKCCPPTDQDPFGTCAEDGGVCCTSEQGGGSCPEDLPTCCPLDCCEDGATCCGPDGECPTGTVCDFDGEEGACCVPEPITTAAGKKSSARKAHRERFYKKAK
jgi:hypothetical protein